MLELPPHANPADDFQKFRLLSDPVNAFHVRTLSRPSRVTTDWTTLSPPPAGTAQRAADTTTPSDVLPAVRARPEPHLPALSSSSLPLLPRPAPADRDA